MSALRISRVTVEHRPEALGIGVATPRLSWCTETDMAGWMQAGYELRIAGADGQEFSTGVVDANDSVLVAWPAPPLRSRERRTVHVRVIGADGSESPWSEPLTVEAGLLEASDWQATFVGPAREENLETPQPCPYLRRSFAVSAPVTRARLYVTALGVYELELNGRRIGDHVLAPGWNSYHHQLRYDTFDVTDVVQQGENAVGVVLGDGWYRGALVENLQRNRYGNRLGVLCRLELTHADGSTTIVVSDDRMACVDRPHPRHRALRGRGLRRARRAHRLVATRLRRCIVDAGDRRRARPRNADRAERAADPGHRTDQHRSTISTSPSGRTIVDFGQNLVGVVELAVTGPAGTDDHAPPRRGVAGR